MDVLVRTEQQQADAVAPAIYYSCCVALLRHDLLKSENVLPVAPFIFLLF